MILSSMNNFHLIYFIREKYRNGLWLKYLSHEMLQKKGATLFVSTSISTKNLQNRKVKFRSL